MRSYGCSRSEPEIARVYLSNNRSMFSLFRECRSLPTSYRYVHGVVICVDGPEKPSWAATRVRVMNIKDKCVLVLHWGTSQGGRAMKHYRVSVWLPMRNFAVASACAALSACSTVQAITNAVLPGSTPAQAAATALAPPPAAEVPPPSPSGLKRFSEVVKDAKVTPGFFTTYEKDEKIWLEIKPEQFEQLFFFSIGNSQGLGERGVYGGQMGRSYVAQFRKIGGLVQLIAHNAEFTAKPGTPISNAVRTSFSDSLLGAALIVSLPNPDSKSVLIEANALLLADIPMAAARLEAAFHQSYGFDTRNSGFTGMHNMPETTSFAVSAHYWLGRVSLSASGTQGTSTTPLPETLPDVRSLFLGFRYTLAKLPEPMTPRLADDRIGHFVTTRWDYTTDLAPDPRVRYVDRWRLEKKDPAAPLSEPVQPIVFWLDKNIPERYRSAVSAGILEWNKAFEPLGFKNAIQVQIHPDNADFDTSDVRHATVRWFLGTDASFAIGPHRVDPRTGEILDAEIAVSEIWTRGPRRRFLEELPHGASGHGDTDCSYLADAYDEMAFGMELLEARGEIEPDSPQSEALVLATLKDVITHEVGHALGLRHNFRASTVYSAAQLSDAEFTRKHGLTGSVMDYNAWNIAVKGERQGEYVMSTLGPYDYWAIEYAYRPLEPANEKDELAKIASRSTEPFLAFGTDVDAGFGGSLEGIDPDVNRFDLGADPLVFFQRQLTLARELWDRLQDKQLAEGEGYAVLRRNFDRGFTLLGRALPGAVKQIGGLITVSDHYGSHRAPLTPVAAAKQRTALKWLETGLFSVDSFKFKPEFMSRLVLDPLERDSKRWVIPDYPLYLRLLSLQRGVLDQLMSEMVANRVLNADLKLVDPSQGFKLSELYETLQNTIWKELKTGQDISALRRNLQREHLRRTVNMLIQPSPTLPADAKSLTRENAIALRASIQTALKKKGYGREAHAHLAESLSTLDEALKAQLQRSGV